jgi:hypothetical protein
MNKRRVFSIFFRAGIFLPFLVFQGCNPTSSSSESKLTSTVALPNWVAGQFGAYTLTANGGTPPYDCKLNAGSALPLGFALSANCVLSGIAPLLAAGTTKSISPPFTVIIADSSRPPDSINVVLRITIVQPPPQIILLTPGPIQQGQYASVGIAQATGGSPPYSFSSDTYANGTPPPGMIIDLNGNLKGTPSLAGTFTFGVCVKDLSAASSCAQDTITVVKKADTLKVIKAGAGSGTVTSNPVGINCGMNCSGVYASGTNVGLNAIPDSGSWFAGWTGACSGTGACNVILDTAQTVTATFGKTYSGAFSTPVTETETMTYGSCTWSATVTGTVAMDLLPQSD